MKAQLLIMIIILIAALCGCRSLKQVNTSENLKEAVTVAENKGVSTMIDTTKNSLKETKVVEITFTGKAESSKVVTGDNSLTNICSTSATIDGNRYEGNIQSVKVTTITKAKEEKGITKSDSTLKRDVFKTSDKQVASKQDIAKDPYRWRWYLGILLLLSGLGYFIYRKFFS